MILTTARLILRPWQEEDARQLFLYAKDPDVGPNAGWRPHPNAAFSRDIIRTVLSCSENYAVCLRTDNKPIGCIGLKLTGQTDMTDCPDECELGFWVGKPFWGQGLIPEAGEALLRRAFVELGMRAVWCGCYDGNERSARVQEKLGFSYHHFTPEVDVPQLGCKRAGHVRLLTREQWQSRLTDVGADRQTQPFPS